MSSSIIKENESENICHDSWIGLNIDCLIKIFLLLDHNNKLNFSSICKKYMFLINYITEIPNKVYKHIDDYLIQKFKGLQKVNISGHDLSRNITPKTVIKLNSLKEIKIENCFKIEIGVLSKLTCLNKLSLKYIYNITDINELSKLTNLRCLKLYNNISIHGEESEYNNKLMCSTTLTNLETLYITNSNIISNYVLQGFTNLTKLYTSRNRLIDDKALRSLTKLKILSLSSNKKIIKGSLEYLTNLTDLNLFNNDIKIEIFGLTKLKN